MSAPPDVLVQAWIRAVALFSVLALGDAKLIRLATCDRFFAIHFFFGVGFVPLVCSPLAPLFASNRL
jgi:hypothetical protein